MGRKKGQGAGRNGRDSNGQRRGVKCFSGHPVKAGNIIIRQKGTRIHPGINVGMGKDFTIYAKIDGKVVFQSFGKERRKVSVIPMQN